MEQALRAVDSVEFLVLIDNCLDSLSTVPKHVSLEWPRLMRNGMKELSGEGQCCANHGLSLLVTARERDVVHTIMFDAGPENYTLERNAPRLGVDFSAIDGIVLSHGHWDHAGGLPAAVRLAGAANGNRSVPVFVHPKMFRQRAMTLVSGDVLPIKAIPNPQELRELGANVLSSTAPQLLFDDFFWISGEIPRVTSYEKGFSGSHAPIRGRFQLGTGPSHHGRAFRCRPHSRQGDRRVHRLLTCGNSQRSPARQRVFFPDATLRSHRRLPSLGGE